MNMRRFIFFLIVCEFFSLACIAANKSIKGHIVDEFGKNVEFASVYVDSIYAVSDKEGNFSLVVPDGMKQELVISHISYQTNKIPYDVYSKKTSLLLTLKEKTCDLSDITVVSGKKQESILGKGVRAPGDVAFHNIRNTKYETGPLFVVNKDYYVKTAKLRVQKCTFASCTIRLIIYEVKGTVFVPVQHRPLYVRLSEISDKKDLSVWIEEPLKLERNHKYYIGVAVMASSGNGEIHFPAYFKKGCVRNLCTDRKKNLPVTLGVSLYGISAKHLQ